MYSELEYNNQPR